MTEQPTSLRDRIAQLVFLRIGSNLPPTRTVSEDADALAARIDATPVGGLCLFNGDSEGTSRTLCQLQRRAKYPLLIGTDMERGIGQQIRGLTSFPHAMAYDAMGEAGLDGVARYAKASAREALAHGIHIAWAPVADVHTNTQNPIIATRAFGTEPVATAAKVARYIEVTQQEGLLTTAKHFPGHGNTSDDSHDTLPTVNASRENLFRVELEPFRAAIRNDVALVMTAHVAYPAIDPRGLPATLSYPLLTTLLREELGFRGVIVSDSLLMAGVRREAVDEGELAVQAIASGVDLLLDVRDERLVVGALERAIAEQRISETRLDESVARVVNLRRHFVSRFGDDFFVEPRRYVDPGDRSENASLSLAIARTAIRCLDSRIGLPLTDPGKVLCIQVQPHSGELPQDARAVAGRLAERSIDHQFQVVGPDLSLVSQLADEATTADTLLICLVVKPAAWHHFGLLEEQTEWIRQLLNHPRAIVASLGVPTVLDDFPISRGATLHVQ